LVRLAANRLRNLTGRAALNSPEDLALSAFQSFCKRATANGFPELADRIDLWKLLATITTRKAAREYRRTHAAATFDHALDAVVSKEPTPELAAAMVDAMEQLVAALPDEAHRTVALKKFEGCTNKEIAAILNRSTKNVEYKLRNIRAFWVQLLGDGSKEEPPA
jgi:DNA-directed RNA polymerase specialized sigma24 family protein